LPGCDVEADVAEGMDLAARRLEAHREMLDLKSRPACLARHHTRPVRRSRTPSPRRLKPTMVRARARPGQRSGQDERKIYWRASRIISPQSAVGGWTPRPRKDRLAEARMAKPTRMLASITVGGRRLGRISPNMM